MHALVKQYLRLAVVEAAFIVRHELWLAAICEVGGLPTRRESFELLLQPTRIITRRLVMRLQLLVPPCQLAEPLFKHARVLARRLVIRLQLLMLPTCLPSWKVA